MKTKSAKLIYCALLLISIAVGKANAQMVYLPDTNFRNWIATNYPGAIVGDSLDTNNAGVVNETWILCSNQNISDLTGVEAFVNAVYLDASYNALTTFLPIPPQVVQVDLSYNNISSIATIPPYLQWIYCNYNNLSALPTLPFAIRELSCIHNALTSLPSLPSTLELLSCDDNSISSLPLLPSSLLELSCAQNNLTSLPQLPISLVRLNCSENINLSCLPQLHDMQNLSFTSTAISCIPNYIICVSSYPYIDTFPLCDIFNANSCDFYWNISGQTFLDSNANCSYDNADSHLQNIPLQLLSSGNLLQQTSSNYFGKYDFDTDSLAVYEVRVDTTDLPFDVICPGTNLYSDTITTIDSLKTGRDFSFQCKNVLQVGIKSIDGGFIPGRFITEKINVEDLALFYGMHCSSGESGVVTTTLYGPVTYISPEPGALTPTTIAVNLLTYTVSDFGALFIGAFDIIVQTDTFATIGTQVCITVTTTTTNLSTIIKKDSLHQCFAIVGSFDPNNKQVSPVSDIDINGDGWLIYTINFQNTGTAQAFDIYLLDTLDNNLDWSTFKLTAYSHQPQIQLFNTVLS